MNNKDKIARAMASKVSTQLSDMANELNGLEIPNTNVTRSINVTLDETIIKQSYLGGYIEIQPDSWDGAVTATDSSTKTWGFPHSLIPSERSKIKANVFNGEGKGIMYIRLPLGFAYRGFRNIDGTSGLAKNIGERYRGQNTVLKSWFDKISVSGGGLAPEYWCPPPHWVTSGSYSGINQLRAGGVYPMTTTLESIKSTDLTQYDAQISAFTDAIVNDLEYLHQNIAPVRMFGLQNEPAYQQQNYGACKYDAQTYNDVLSILYPKILASTILSYCNDEINVVKLLVASSDEGSPFTGIANTFITNNASMIWGYTHHSMREASGENYASGADWYKSTYFTAIKGSKTNVFINEYEYFDINFGTYDFRCSNNMLHLINEVVCGEAQVLHPVIHVCKPIGQTQQATNTKGYCLFEVNLNGNYGLSTSDIANKKALNKGCMSTNPTMYNSWAMFNDNLPVGSYLVGNYTDRITRAGWCAYKYNGKLYLFFANNSDGDASITITFSGDKQFEGKIYNMKHCGDVIKSKTGTTIEFVIPASSGLAWIEKTQQSSNGTIPVADAQAPIAPISLVSSNITSTGFTLTWSASTDNIGVTGYDVYNGTTLVGSTTTALTYNVTGLTPSTTYSFTVKAKDLNGNISDSSIVLSVTTLVDTAVVVASDSFNRVNNVSSLGNAETGQTWNVVTGTWGIISNAAYISSTSASNDRAYIESNLSDCIVSVKLSNIGLGGRMLFRYADINNQWQVYGSTGNYLLSKRVASTITTVTTISVTPTNNDILKVVLNGSNIKVYVNDILKADIVDTALLTATKHGIGNYNDTTARFDDFKIQSLA